MLLWFLIFAVITMLIYIRVAPTDPTRWHTPVDAVDDQDMIGGVIRIVSAPDFTLQSLDEIALQTPRTQRISGHPSEGRVTYMTRSFWIGFPDYTTVDQVDGVLKLHARLRFGRSDLGVNRARVEAWLRALKN